MTDKKIEEYLVRAFDIAKNKFIEKSEFKIGNIVEIAKMIQLEEHRERLNPVGGVRESL